jgi:diguanylate cyclase (GGDEF)-like protein
VREFFNVVTFDATGLLIGSLRDTGGVGTERFSERPYFKDTVRKLEGVISEPFVSKLSHKPVILITEPVFDRRGRIACILGGGIDVEQPRFFGQFTRLRPGQTGYLFALTRNGLILHHPDPHRLLNNVLSEPGRPVASTVAPCAGGRAGHRQVEKRNVRPDHLQAHAPARLGDWRGPVDEAFGSVSTARRAALIGAAMVGMLAGCAGWYVTRSLLRPLALLRAKVLAVERGQLDIQAFDSKRHDEVGALGRALYSLSVKRQVAEDRLSLLGMSDPLTGLGNRRRLNDEFKNIAGRARRTKKSIGFAILDIDHFKSINDKYGHDVGDLVLKEFASRLKDAVRSIDQVCRLAGDEFVIVFENLESDAAVDDIAQKILEKVRLPVFVSDRVLSITTSIGITVCGWENAELGALLSRADKALYDTKKRGRNGFTVNCLPGREQEPFSTTRTDLV